MAMELEELQGGKSYVSKIGKSIFIFGTLRFIHKTPFYITTFCGNTIFNIIAYMT